MNRHRTRNRGLLILVIALAIAAAYFVGRETAAPESVQTASDESGGRKVLYWQAPMNPSEIYDKPGKSAMGMDLVPVYEDEEPMADSGKQEEREILYWQAPMNPAEIYDKPGKSAMGMDLIPVYADEAGKGSGGIVSIDPAVVQNMGVRMAPVERMDFTRTIRTVGQVEYDEESQHIVTTKISGWIEKLYVAFTGEAVKKGQPLLEIYSPELVTTQQEYLLALNNRKRAQSATSEAALRDADKLLSSTRERLLYWDIPEAEIERLERTGEVQKTVLLEAQASGIVVKKMAVEGAFIKAGMDLFEIASLSSVWVHASVYDNEVPWIREGQPAEMELSYQPGKTYSGRVSYIYPYLREKARDVHVRVIFPNPDLALKPGMYVNVTLQGKVVPDAIVVPSEAVIRSGARALVFVVAGQGKFEPREIRIGEEGGPGNAYVHVLSGLLGTEEVVTSAQFMLDSESRLQEAIQKMLNARNTGGDSTSGTDRGSMAQPQKGEVDSGSQDMEGTDHGDHKMKGMDHGDQPKMENAASDSHNMDNMKGMDHGDGKMEGRDRAIGKSGEMDHSGHDMNGMDHGNQNMGAMDQENHSPNVGGETSCCPTPATHGNQ